MDIKQMTYDNGLSRFARVGAEQNFSPRINR